MIGIKLIAIALSVITFCLCACQGQRGNGQVDGNVSDTIDYGEVNDSLVMKYISCPKSIVDTLLDKGDSIYLHANEHKLEFLGLDNEEYNRRLVAKYGDTIPAIVSIYESYDLLTSYGEDEVLHLSCGRRWQKHIFTVSSNMEEKQLFQKITLNSSMS